MLERIALLGAWDHLVSAWPAAKKQKTPLNAYAQSSRSKRDESRTVEVFGNADVSMVCCVVRRMTGVEVEALVTPAKEEWLLNLARASVLTFEAAYDDRLGTAPDETCVAVSESSAEGDGRAMPCA